MVAGKHAGGYVLRAPEDEAERARCHEIRLSALFEPYHPGVTYDPDHPDERRPGNYPLILLQGDDVIGTVRIDLLDADRAALRLVAIDPDRQRQGHGAALLRLAEDFVRGHGRRRVVVHGNPATIGIYLRNGYGECSWADDAVSGPHIDLAKNL